MKIVEFAFIGFPVIDLARARHFYEEVLGFERKSQPGDEKSQWFEYEIGPHTLGIGRSPAMKPSSDGATLALEVDDFDAFVQRLKQNEVKFVVEPSQMPHCRMAMFLDTEGNKLCIHKRNPE
ncbi:MAG: Glyoxalase/bleomycin resistance protein/dioxygenase [Verrucomicrobiaceae bacterium]|nr:Glyoxalase/bleomycin resistance protein/dioxygenase [Verrucomicrobiaceae bacterium]